VCLCGVVLVVCLCGVTRFSSYTIIVFLLPLPPFGRPHSLGLPYGGLCVEFLPADRPWDVVSATSRSWLRDTLKRKLVDFAWNRRFFYFPGACSPFFGYTRLKVLINPIFIIRSACFDQSSSQPWVNPGKQEGGGGATKFKNRRVFFSRYLAANDGALAWRRGPVRACTRVC